MMDYLSFLTLRKRNCSNLPDLDRQDYVILNSTANVSKAIDVLHGYGRIHCMLDNDEAGRKAYRELERKFAGRIRDFSDNYKGHKDLNDYLRGIRQKLAVSPPPRTIVNPRRKGWDYDIPNEKTGDARNSFLKDWEVASLCFGCTETLATHHPNCRRWHPVGLYS